MIEHVWEQATQANIGEVVVACCGPEIADHIHALGGKAIITDPNLPSGTDRVWAAAAHTDAAIIVNLQGDLPFIAPSTIAQTIKPLLENPAVHISTAAALIENAADILTPSVVKIAMNLYAPDRGRALYFSRAPIPHGQAPHYHHLGIYAFRRSALERFVSLPPSHLEQSEKLEQLRALEDGMRIDVALVNDTPQSVDTPEDLAKLNNV
jgi:3-deoxy-manno-octulosonate cytidylyltransferase (CMP-KDO synthetase)